MIVSLRFIEGHERSSRLCHLKFIVIDLEKRLLDCCFFQTTRLIAASVEMTRHNISKALIAMFLIRLPRIKSFLIRCVKFIALIVSANKIVIIGKIESKILWSLVSGVNFR